MRMFMIAVLSSGLAAGQLPSAATAATPRQPVRTAARMLTPPASVLQLCVASQDAPQMFRLYRLVDLLKENHRTITWQRSGGDWVMRERWFDDLTRRPHEIAFELAPLAGAVTGPYCPQNRAEISVTRLVVDGVEMNGWQFVRTLSTHTQAIFGDDRPPPGTPPVPRNALGGAPEPTAPPPAPIRPAADAN